MYDDKTIGRLFPTRSGVATGQSNERTMLDHAGDTTSFTTVIRPTADGGTTRLRTKGGMPQFETTQGNNGSGAPIFRGLAAWPVGFSPDAYRWSPPVVFSAAHFPDYKVAITNPEQLAATPFYYHVGLNGCVSGTNGRLAYVGHAAVNERYTKVTRLAALAQFALLPADFEAPRYPPLPFLCHTTAAPTIFWTSSNAIAARNGTTLNHFAPMTVLNAPEQESKVADHLPCSIAADGSAVALHAKDARNFSDPLSAYYTNELCYWHALLSAPLFAGAPELAKIEAVYYFKHASGNIDSGDYLPVTADIEKMSWTLIWPITQSPYHQWFSRPVDGAPPRIYIDIMCRVGVETRHESTLQSQRRGYFKWPFSVTHADSRVIGYAAGVSPITLSVDCAYHRDIDIEGQQYISLRDDYGGTEDHNFANGLYPTPRAVVGPKTSLYQIKEIKVDGANHSRILVSSGTISVVTFEVDSSTRGHALYKRREATSMMTRLMNWEPFKDDLRISPLVRFTESLAAPGVNVTTPMWDASTFPAEFLGSYAFVDWTLTTPHSEFIPETEYSSYAAALNSQPILKEACPQLFSEQIPVELQETDYGTTIDLTATSRFILAFDLRIELAVYVEMTVSHSTELIGPTSKNWLYPRYTESDHTVTCKFVVEYQGARYSDELFSVTVTKPVVMYETETTNWYKWPVGPNQIDIGMRLCAEPLLLPTPSTFKGIDGVFMHQGVCEDFAGFTRGEELHPADCGCPTANLHKCIYAKRFKLIDNNMDWLLTATKVDECKRGATALNATEAELQRFFYSPELKALVEETWFEVEFDETGLRAWVAEVPPTYYGATVAPQPNRDASCWRI